MALAGETIIQHLSQTHIIARLQGDLLKNMFSETLKTKNACADGVYWPIALMQKTFALMAFTGQLR